MAKYTLLLIIAGLGMLFPNAVADKKITASDMPAIRKIVASRIKKDKPQRFAGKANVEKYSKLLDENGRFKDIRIDHKKIRYINYKTQLKLSKQLKKALLRIRDMSWAFQAGMIKGEDVSKRILKAIVYYCGVELQRKYTRARWPYSPIVYPRYTYVIYFSFFPQIDQAGGDKLLQSAAEVLQRISYQAFTLPPRNDIPNPLNIDHYRNNKAWVGGNFSYRRPFINATVCNRPDLLNVAKEVCRRAVSVVSHNTHDEAFWQEGLCADGCAWGHGKQSYAFGYGIDGINGLLKTMKFFQDAKQKVALSHKQFSYLLNFGDAMTWLQYRDRANLSVIGRHNLRYRRSRYIVRIERYLENLEALNPPADIKKRLDDLRMRLKNNGAELEAGVRYFWNNDDLVMRGKNYHVFVNMISSRSCGPESVASSSSGVNYNLADGTAMILKAGDEYDKTVGGWNFATPPGTTARNVELPKKNVWRGFFSKHNFAGGIGGKTGVAGFILEKYMSAKVSKYKFEELCGIKAQKAYFMYPGVLIALGSGITNDNPDVKGEVITNINQTALGKYLESRIDDKEVKYDAPYKFTVDLPKINKPVVMWQRGIGYAVFSSQGNLNVIGGLRKARWAEINRRNRKYKNLPKHVNLFDISINHGKKPGNAGYAYMVALNSPDFRAMKKIVDSERFKIVANTKGLQAVYDHKMKIAQMVFYNPKNIYKYNNFEVSVNYPVVVRVSARENGKLKISVADPTQNPTRKDIELTINNKKIKIALSRKPFCGKQVDMVVKP